MTTKKSKTKKMPVKVRTRAEEGKIAVEPSDAARRKVAGKTKLPGDTGGSFCRNPAAMNISPCIHTACICDCTCSNDCACACDCDCGTECPTDCDCGSSYKKIGELEQRIASLESLVQVRFGDIEKILERISLNTRKQ